MCWLREREVDTGKNSSTGERTGSKYLYLFRVGERLPPFLKKRKKVFYDTGGLSAPD